MSKNKSKIDFNYSKLSKDQKIIVNFYKNAKRSSSGIRYNSIKLLPDRKPSKVKFLDENNSEYKILSYFKVNEDWDVYSEISNGSQEV